EHDGLAKLAPVCDYGKTERADLSVEPLEPIPILARAPLRRVAHWHVEGHAKHGLGVLVEVTPVASCAEDVDDGVWSKAVNRLRTCDMLALRGAGQNSLRIWPNLLQDDVSKVCIARRVLDAPFIVPLYEGIVVAPPLGGVSAHLAKIHVDPQEFTR